MNMPKSHHFENLGVVRAQTDIGVGHRLAAGLSGALGISCAQGLFVQTGRADERAVLLVRGRVLQRTLGLSRHASRHVGGAFGLEDACALGGADRAGHASDLDVDLVALAAAVVGVFVVGLAGGRRRRTGGWGGRGGTRTRRWTGSGGTSWVTGLLRDTADVFATAKEDVAFLTP